MPTQTKPRPPQATSPQATERRSIRRFTRQEYERMIETGVLTPDDRCELLEGKIVEKMPQSSRHSNTVRRVSRALQPVYSLDSYLLNVQLPLTPSGADSEPEPDVSVVEGQLDDYEDKHPATALLVVEVSDTSLADDRTRKQRIYARAGVAEYWIVNLADAALEVHREPQGEGYDRRETLRPPDAARPPQSDAEIAVADLLP